MKAVNMKVNISYWEIIANLQNDYKIYRRLH